MNKTSAFIIVAIALLAAALVGVNAWRSSLVTQPPQNPATTTRPIVGGETIQVGGEAIVPRYRGAPIDALATDEILQLLTQEQKNKYLGELARLAAYLKENPADIVSWLQAASLKNFFNDYQGARDIWEYVTTIANEDMTAYLNLGTLYTWNLPDFPAAERNFKRAIAAAPIYAQGYIRLAELYRMFWTEKKSEAPNVLLEGLKKIPRDRDLLLALGLTYRESGDTANALKYYEEYAAQDPNNTDVNKIIAELKAI